MPPFEMTSPLAIYEHFYKVPTQQQTPLLNIKVCSPDCFCAKLDFINPTCYLRVNQAVKNHWTSPYDLGKSSMTGPFSTSILVYARVRLLSPWFPMALAMLKPWPRLALPLTPHRCAGTHGAFLRSSGLKVPQPWTNPWGICNQHIWGFPINGWKLWDFPL